MFEQVADGVYVARTQPLDVNVTLVVGSAGALVVDTLSTQAQARALLAAVRSITGRPLIVVNTHFHYDHCFGNAVFAAAGAPIYGHPATVAELTSRGDRWQRTWSASYASTDPGFAEALAAVEIHAPDQGVPEPVRLDLGGRSVTIIHPGRGHTAGDLVVFADDVVVAGDLIEEGAPPDFGDAYPLEWPEAVAAIVRSAPAGAIVVPGHGAVVDVPFARAFHGRLSELDWLIRDGHRDGGPVEAVAERAPWPATGMLPAVRRGYAALDP